MKFKKVFCAAVLVLTLLASSVFAAPQDALSLRPDNSFYIAIGLSDAGNLSRWVLSQENIDAFMPFIRGIAISIRTMSGFSRDVCSTT